MTQMPVSFSRMAYQRGDLLMEDQCSRRLTLTSIKNLDQLATASIRVKQHRYNPKINCSRDFAAYFQSSPRNGDPIYVTSHTNPEPLLKRSTVVPVFPMVQSLRWNPCVETSSIEDMTSKLINEPKLHCKCERCTKQHCPSKMSASSTLKSYHTNIMTFDDKCTMTPKLAEAGCGCHRVPSTRESEISVSASEITVRDIHGSTNIDQVYNQRKCPAAPILKKNTHQLFDHDGISYYTDQDYSKDEYDPLEKIDLNPEKDIHDVYRQPKKERSLKSFFKYCRKKKEPLCCNKSNARRIIYNEGISDMIASQYPIVPMRMLPSTSSLKNNCSKGSIGTHGTTKFYNERPVPSTPYMQLPHSHRTDSRYHQKCKSGHSKILVIDNEDVRCKNAPVRKDSCGNPITYYRLPTAAIKLPKKVLTSAKDIESFVDVCYPRTTVPGAGRRRRKS